MSRYALLFAFLLLATTPALAQQDACRNAGMEYSNGATMCECPSLVGAAGHATGGSAKVVSRRLECKNGDWVASDMNCVELNYATSSANAPGEHQRLHTMYCPRAGIAEDPEKFFEKASPSQGLVALTAICRRFSVPPAACSAVIQAVSSTTK